MKKLLICALVLQLSFLSRAQEAAFKPFKFDIALGYAVPAGSGTKGGIVFALEPKYALNDALSLGLRLESALTLQGEISSDGEMAKGDVKASGSYLLTGDYYFTTSRFRPFAGLGAGFYRNAAVDIETEDVEADMKTSSKFGFAPRAGFELGHFRTAIEYNVAGKTGIYNNNYLGIKMGFFIGGGRL